MFERDKDDLREMGIPLVTENNDPLFEDEVGYRIDPNAYALPEIEVGPDEMAVLTLAARAWQQAALAPGGHRGAAQGRGVRRTTTSTPTRPDAAAEGLGLEPRVVDQRARVRPALRGGARPASGPVRLPHASASTETTERHLEPWGVVSWHGRWYVVGHDSDRDATRVFRLSRIEGDVRTRRRERHRRRPRRHRPGHRRRDDRARRTDPRRHVLRVRRGAGHALRRAATVGRRRRRRPRAAHRPVPRGVARSRPTSSRPSAVALEPPELREACVASAARHPRRRRATEPPHEQRRRAPLAAARARAVAARPPRHHHRRGGRRVRRHARSSCRRTSTCSSCAACRARAPRTSSTSSTGATASRCSTRRPSRARCAWPPTRPSRSSSGCACCATCPAATTR